MNRQRCLRSHLRIDALGSGAGGAVGWGSWRKACLRWMGWARGTVLCLAWAVVKSLPWWRCWGHSMEVVINDLRVPVGYRYIVPSLARLERNFMWRERARQIMSFLSPAFSFATLQKFGYINFFGVDHGSNRRLQPQHTH